MKLIKELEIRNKTLRKMRMLNYFIVQAVFLTILITSCKKHTDVTNLDNNVLEVQLPAGEYDMGDHFGFVDPGHPSDETPIHKVKVNSFYIATTETTNKQFLEYLNGSFKNGSIEVRNNMVYAVGGNDIYYLTYQYSSYYSIGFDGSTFSIIG
jgi:formylglycine-generating enzyme required for sulfatase activity